MTQPEKPSPDELVHFGVKGMKWGVRTSNSTSGGPSRKVVKADKKFENNASSGRTFVAIHNGAAKRMNDREVDRINNKPKYRDGDLVKPSKLRDDYHKEFQNAFTKALRESARDQGTNASGTRRYGINADKDGNWEVRTEAVKHADEDILFIVVPKYDVRGRIVSLSIKQNSMKHFGTKGMKWGVRREANRAARVQKGGELVKAGAASGKKVTSKRLALRGAAEVAGILVGGSLVVNRLPLNPIRAGAQVAKIGAAGYQGAVRVTEIRAVNAYNKSQQKK